MRCFQCFRKYIIFASIRVKFVFFPPFFTMSEQDVDALSGHLLNNFAISFNVPRLGSRPRRSTFRTLVLF